MWPFDDILGAVNALYELVINIPGNLIDIGVALLNLALYPFVVLFWTMGQVYNSVCNPFVDFLNAFIVVPNSLIDLVNSLFVGTFPTVWTLLLISSVLLAAGLRVYSFLKDISIVGNKI